MSTWPWERVRNKKMLLLHGMMIDRTILFSVSVALAQLFHAVFVNDKDAVRDIFGGSSIYRRDRR